MSKFNKNKLNLQLLSEKQEVVSISYEEIGLFPRSFSRVLERFFNQIFADVENLVIQEYRFYRYLFLTTLKCVFILGFVPLLINFLTKNYFIRPLTEYFWNTKQTEIFLNFYQQKRAYAEIKDFEEKLYFESLILPQSDLIKLPLLGDFEQRDVWGKGPTPYSKNLYLFLQTPPPLRNKGLIMGLGPTNLPPPL